MNTSMNKESEKDIRRLLDLYYQGETSITEERQIAEYFTSHKNLPDDLMSDNYLFMSLNNKNSFIPKDADKKLIEALEEEIKKPKKSFDNRLIWYALSAVAACLLIGYIGLKIFSPQNNTNSQTIPLLSEIVNDNENNTDTTVKHFNLANYEKRQSDKQTIIKKDEIANTDSKNRTCSTSISPSISKEEITVDEEPCYLTIEEEEQLEARNYRVVRDEDEAFVIMNSVFSQLDGKIKESNYRIVDISDKYERVATKF